MGMKMWQLGVIFCLFSIAGQQIEPNKFAASLTLIIGVALGVGGALQKP